MLTTAMLILALAAPTPTPQDRTVTVGISHFVPFAITDTPTPTGYSIDLWRGIARILGVNYTFRAYPNVADKLTALQRGEVDVVIGGVTITAEREALVDFSQPTFRTGLDIMVPAGSGGWSWAAISRVLSPGKLGIIIGFLLLIIISGHLVWLAERGKDAFDDKYIPGVFEGMYWAIVTASTVGYGDKAPVRWAGRAVASLVIIISLPMFALFTAELASSFTVQSMESAIRGPDDLAGKRVGVVRGTVSEDEAHALKADTRSFGRIDEAYAALAAHQLDAVVYDEPNMRYHVRHQGKGELALIGRLFKTQHYGIAVREEDPLLEQINRAMLTLRESGEDQRIRQQWFGD